MENRKNQRAKISSATLITDLPEFERENGLLDVNDTVRKIEQKFSPGSDNKARLTRPRVNQQTKDIGAQILGSDYGKLRNKVRGLVSRLFLSFLFCIHTRIESAIN